GVAAAQQHLEADVGDGLAQGGESLPGVLGEEVAVISVPDEKWGETIKALVVLAEGESVSEAEIIAHCKERMAGYKAPTSVEFRDSIPRTATGKIQKFKLREPYWAGKERGIN
ncbi:hypothetical protein ABZ372_45430, partial [Streptomyces sp. NPDC005921]